MTSNLDASLSGSTWRKATRSQGNGGACVEIVAAADAIAVRDSKNSDGTKLILGGSDWRALVGEIKAGSWDLS
jgi:Domain of unknown function (DUF397).